MIDRNKLRTMREEKNISQEELAEAVLASQPLITRIERGVKQPSIDLLQRIAAYFNCSLDDLVIPLQREDTA